LDLDGGILPMEGANWILFRKISAQTVFEFISLSSDELSGS
jgi:hypothetical protein